MGIATAVIALIIGLIIGAKGSIWGPICSAWNEIGSYWIIIVGLLSFFIPLVLSFSKRLNLGTRLSKGEVRKSIVISFTVVYIILLVQSFEKTRELATSNATINAITNAASNVTINATVTAATNNATTQAIPIEAIGNFTQNFLYVYIIIIGFYFGSRLCEHFKVFQALKDVDPLDIAKKRYAMGDIDSTTFNGIKNDFEAEPVLKILEVNKDIIKIKHKGGEEIDLKNATMIIKANDKRTTIHPADKEVVFKAGDVMEIENGGPIKIGDEPTGGAVPPSNRWEENGTVEVSLFYTGERKIMMIGEVKGKQTTGEASKTGAERTAEQSSNNESE